MGSFMGWQEAGAVIVACVMAVGCGDDGGGSDETGGDDTTGSPTTTSPTTSMSTSTTTTDPSTTSTGPDTTGEPMESTTTGEPMESTTTGEPMESTTTGESMTESTSGETTTGTTSDATTMGMTTEMMTTGDCPDGDDDGDMICNGEDLCDDLLATHCLEFGIDGSAIFDNYMIDGTGVFDDLLDADILVGVSLDVASLAEPALCDDALNTTAKQYDAMVLSMTMISSDPAADAYLQDVVLEEFATEGVGDTIRFVAQGMGSTALFQAIFSAGMVPGHQFAFQDNLSYMPSCDMVGVDSTITGTNGLFRIDYVGGMGTTDRIVGSGGEYTLYPVGG